MTEALATTVVVASIAAATVLPLSEERDAAQRHAPKGARVITLTGIAKSGTWTEDDVTGANYWNARPTPARPVLRIGEPVLFRLKSIDVMHRFYAPALGVGPIQVEPGHVEEVLVTPKDEGVFDYYCTLFCGDPHFGMRGEIVVTRGDETRVPPPPARVRAYWEEVKPPQGTTRVERGGWLFRKNGCFNCHGDDGKGGVVNWNYISGTVPAAKMLAKSMALREKDDAKQILALLERGVPLKDGALKMANVKVVLAKYESIRDVIRKGNPPGKKDPNGPVPPLEMPAWGQRLSDADIDAVIAYLLTLYPWEEEEKKEREKEKKEEKEEKEEKEKKEDAEEPE